MTVVEFEFNDYPEIARRRISQKDARQGIEDRTGARLQIKGVYTPKGQAPPVGCRKLYVEIMAGTKVACTKARSECFSILEEAAKKTLALPGGGRR